MARPSRLVLILLALLPDLVARAALAQNPMAAVHARDWPRAMADAAVYPDPVAVKLIAYSRVLTPGAATPGEIAAFMRENPDWPNQGALQRRLQEAIADDADDQAVLGLCTAGPITSPTTLARCAAALAASGNMDAAIADARKAWVTGYADPEGKGPFLARWSSELRPEDDWQRFAYFAAIDPAAAARQIPRLAPTVRAAAEVRLALIHDAPDAFARARAVASVYRDPAFVLDEARYLRRAHRDADALAFWRGEGQAAEQAAGALLPAFWGERNILARELLKDGDNEGAYQIAADTLQVAPEQIAESAFLAGFVALRRLHDLSRAAVQFRRLAEVSKAAITQARAHFWLAQADLAAGQDPRPEYERAAAYPTTFFGQLAARALGEDPATRILAARDPAYSGAQAWNFVGQELVRAAAFLVAWGEPGRARAFLLRVQEVASDPADQALAAKLALALDMPDTAVFIARRMGVGGGMLPGDGWPSTVEPPDGSVDPAVVLALIRQESSFDHGAVSPAGARGLMQLMPGTAEKLAQRIGGEPPTQASLVTDPIRNVRLGTAYLRGLLDEFSGSLPLAVAAYNAGPRKVSEWLATYGDPRSGAIDMVDWIELIPYGETRNYVERVLENVVIYRARRGEAGDEVLAQWMH